MSVSGPQYSVYLRNPDYTVKERLDVWTNLIFIKRFNGVGTWNLEVPTKSRIARFITPDTGIILQRDGQTIFSGPAGYTAEHYIETNDVIKLSGVDDNILLETTTRPTPSQSEAPYDDEYDVTTGIASTIMRSLVIRNIGASAPDEWRIDNLSMDTDPLLGSPITARSRFDPLITLLASLASTPTASGLGFDIVQQDLTTDILFNVYQPIDNSETKFSIELRTAENYEWKHQIPAHNWFIVAGGDDFGPNRTIVEGGDAEAIAAVGRRIPEFVDARGITDTSELNQRLAEKLATVITNDIINIIPTDVPSIQYGTHYNLGDIVTAIIRGTSYTRLIREITIDWNPEQGVKIVPTISDPSGSNDDILTQHVYTLQHRLSNIERNFNVPNDSITADMLHPTMKWLVGDMKSTTRAAAQDGWLLCIGTAISRTVYSVLFSVIGTLFGVGNGTTTFNIPDFRDRVQIGAGGTYSRGDTLTGSVSFAHTHAHSHGGGSLHYSHYHTGQAHTHPGSHSHGAGNISISHTHQTNIDHDHEEFDSGGEDTFAATFSTYPGTTTNVSHRHNINVPPLGDTDVNSSTPNSVSRSGSTDADSNVFAASYSGSPSNETENISPWTGGSDSDSTSGGGSITATPPSQAVNIQIYTGVVL